MPTGGTRVGQVAPEELGCPNAENRRPSNTDRVPQIYIGAEVIIVLSIGLQR